MAKDDKSTTNGSPLKITMGSLRLTGDQAERLLTIHRAKAVECYEHWDWRLRDLGLVTIGPIPPALKAAKEKWLAAAWVKVRNMVGVKMPSLQKIKEIEGLLNQMDHAAYRMDRKYSTLTAVGKELAANGRAVILPSDKRAFDAAGASGLAFLASQLEVIDTDLVKPLQAIRGTKGYSRSKPAKGGGAPAISSFNLNALRQVIAKAKLEARQYADSKS